MDRYYGSPPRKPPDGYTWFERWWDPTTDEIINRTMVMRGGKEVRLDEKRVQRPAGVSLADCRYGAAPR